MKKRVKARQRRMRRLIFCDAEVENSLQHLELWRGPYEEFRPETKVALSITHSAAHAG